MAYRDDRQALQLQVSELERQNEELRDQLTEARAQARDARAEDRDRRHDSALRTCTVCGGALLPVAVFAGHNDRSPLPLRMSTMRFVAASGGFTQAAAIQAKACTSCGFIHQFIDMPETREDGHRETWPPLGPTADDEPPAEQGE
ncbi:MAG: hypothetical protein K0V04_37840 [Deltaproteobacteria bacterium]|nr:hypothetical protein [Deltaproteobacteria bacterium]